MTSKKQPPAARVVRPRVNPHTDPTEGKTGYTEDILNSLTVEELREYINYTRWNQTFGTFDTGNRYTSQAYSNYRTTQRVYDCQKLVKEKEAQQ